MTKPAARSASRTIGLGIAKASFAVQGFDAEGRTVSKQALKRHQVPAVFAGLAACASAQRRAREPTAPGHGAGRIPAQRVRVQPPIRLAKPRPLA